MSTRTLSLLFACALAASAPVRAEELELKTPDQKALYAMGTGMARDLLKLQITPEELRYLLSGIQDHYAKKPRVNLDEEGVAKNLQRFQRERIQAAVQVEDQANKKFLADAATEKGAKKLSAGLVYLELKAGEGKQPQPSDQVRVIYKGTLRDGRVFDQGLDPSKAAEFRLDTVIPCWQQAIAQMRLGGKARFTCAAELAYGAEGAPPLGIPPYATLQFEVEVLGIAEPPPPSAAVPSPEQNKPKK